MRQRPHLETARSGRNAISTLSPHTPLLASACRSLAVVGAALVALLAASFLVTPLPASAVTGAIVAYLALAAVVLAKITRFHPFRRFGLANVMTTGRAAVACGLFGLLVEVHAVGVALPGEVPGLVVWVVGASLVLDGIDGWTARRQGMASRFGARFDMEVDAFTILALAMLALTLGKVGVWVLALGLMRYAFVTASLVFPALKAPLPDSFRRKAICVAQYAALLVAIAPAVSPGAAAMTAGAALFLLILSFGADVAVLCRTPPSTPASHS